MPQIISFIAAPINTCGLACADQGHPRAALDANDLWIGHVRAASSRVVRLICGPRPLWPRLCVSDDSGGDTACAIRDRAPPPPAPLPPATCAACGCPAW